MFSKISNAFNKGRRRFIAREEAIDVPDVEPPVLHTPQVSRVYPPPGTSSKPSYLKSATIDYAPTSATPALKDYSRLGSRSSDVPSRHSTFGRSQTADSSWGLPGPDLRRGRHDSLDSQQSLGSYSSRGGTKDPYPSTYPGGRTQVERERLSDLSDAGTSKAAERTRSGRSGSRGLDADYISEEPAAYSASVSAREHGADSLLDKQHSRASRASSTESTSSQHRHSSKEQQDETKKSMLEKRQEKKARAMAMETAQNPGQNVWEPIGLKQTQRSLMKPPDSPLLQYAPRKAQPFSGRTKSVDSPSSSIPHTGAAALPPAPVPPWKSVSKKQVAKTEEPVQGKVKDKVKSPNRESLTSTKSPEKHSSHAKDASKALSPTAMLVASSSKLMSPIGIGGPPQQISPSALSQKKSGPQTPISPKEQEQKQKSPQPLSTPTEYKKEIVPTTAQSATASTKSPVTESKARADRIAQYKEQRRKELASLYGQQDKLNEVDSYKKHSRQQSSETGEDRIKKNVTPSTLNATPLVATVAPMATTSVTSPITTTSTGTTRVTTTPAMGTTTKVSPSIEKSGMVSPPIVTSPSTLTSTRITPTQGILSLNQTSISSPPTMTKSLTSPVTSTSTALTAAQKSLSPSVTSTLGTAKTSPQSEVVINKQTPVSESSPMGGSTTVTAPTETSAPTGLTSPPQLMSPQMARSLFFADMGKVPGPEGTESQVPKLSPSMIPKAVKPTSLSPPSTSPLPSSSPSRSPVPPVQPLPLIPSLQKPASPTTTPQSPMAPYSPVKAKIKSPLSTSAPFSAFSPTPGSSEGRMDESLTSFPEPPPQFAKQSPTSSATSEVKSDVAAPTVVTASVTSPSSKVTRKDGVGVDHVSVSDLQETGRLKPLTTDLSKEKQNEKPDIETTPLSSKELQRENKGSEKEMKEELESFEETMRQIEEEAQKAVEMVSALSRSDSVAELEPVYSKSKPINEFGSSAGILAEAASSEEKGRGQSQLGSTSSELKPKHKRPFELHIEKPILPEVILSARKEGKTEADTTSHERTRSHDGSDSMVNKDKKSKSGTKKQQGMAPPADIEMEKLEEEVRQMEHRLFGEDYVSPLNDPPSHTELYEQAIVNKRRQTDKQQAPENQYEFKQTLQEMQDKAKEAIQQMEESISAPTGEHHVAFALPIQKQKTTESKLEDQTKHIKFDADLVEPVPSTPVTRTPTTPKSPARGPKKETETPETPPTINAEEERQKRFSRLVREDSFNRADSPIREPMPLPKESVIARHRQSRSRHRNREESASSSDSANSSPVRSPRTSPRSPRKPKIKSFTGSKDSSKLGVGPVPVERERGRSGRPERHQKDAIVSSTSSAASHDLHPLVPPTDPPSRSPSDQHLTMGQAATKSPSAGGTGESILDTNVSSATPGQCPSGASERQASTDLADTSSLPSYQGSDMTKQSSSDLSSLQLPGTPIAGAASDSSTSSSRRETRRRFRTREQEQEDETVPEIKVRPGKKDKSAVRKSFLNTSIDEEGLPDTHRSSDTRRSSAASDEVADLHERRSQRLVGQSPKGTPGSRVRDDSLTSPEPSSDVTSPNRQKAAAYDGGQSSKSPINVASAIGVHARTLSPIAVETASIRTAAKQTSASPQRQEQVKSPIQITTTSSVQPPVKAPISTTRTQVTTTSTRKSPEKLISKSAAEQKVEIPSRVTTSQSSSLRRSPDKAVKASGRVSPEKSLLRRSPEKLVSPTATKVITAPSLRKYEPVQASAKKDIDQKRSVVKTSQVTSPVKKVSSTTDQTFKTPTATKISTTSKVVTTAAKKPQTSSEKSVSTKIAEEKKSVAPVGPTTSASAKSPEAIKITSTVKPQVGSTITTTRVTTSTTVKPAEPANKAATAAATKGQPRVTSPIVSPVSPQVGQASVVSPSKVVTTQVNQVTISSPTVTTLCSPIATSSIRTNTAIEHKKTVTTTPSPVSPSVSLSPTWATSPILSTTTTSTTTLASPPKAQSFVDLKPTVVTSTRLEGTPKSPPADKAPHKVEIKPSVITTKQSTSLTSSVPEKVHRQVEIKASVVSSKPERTSQVTPVTRAATTITSTSPTTVLTTAKTLPSPIVTSPTVVKPTVKSPTSPVVKEGPGYVTKVPDTNKPAELVKQPATPKSPVSPSIVTSSILIPTSPDKAEPNRGFTTQALPVQPKTSVTEIKKSQVEIKPVEVKSKETTTLTGSKAASQHVKSPVSTITSRVTSPTLSITSPIKVTGTQVKAKEATVSQQVTQEVKDSKPAIQRNEVVLGEPQSPSATGTQTLQSPIKEATAVRQTRPIVHKSSVEIKPTTPTPPTSPTPILPEVDFTKYGIPEKVGEPLPNLQTPATKAPRAGKNVISPQEDTKTKTSPTKRWGAPQPKSGPMQFGMVYRKKSPERELAKQEEEKVQTAQKIPAVTESAVKQTTTKAQQQKQHQEHEVSKHIKPAISGKEVSEQQINITSSQGPTSSSRRTPERTQSFRDTTDSRASPEKKVPLRSKSFKENGANEGEMSQRRFKTGPADEQLAKILNRRSRTLEEWEAQLGEREITAQDIAVQEYENKLEQQKMTKPKEEIIEDNEVINVLKARRSEVDSTITKPGDENKKPEVQRQSSSTTIEIAPLANQEPIKKQESYKTEQVPSLVKKESQITKSDSGIKVSSILKSSNQENGVEKSRSATSLHREPAASQPVVTSIKKKETKAPNETTPISITSKSIVRPTSLTKVESPVSPTQQSSTFIMVSSPTRKQDEPFVEVTAGGEKVMAGKSALLQRSDTMRDNQTEETKETKRPLKPILRKAKTVEVSVWDPELENVLKKRRGVDDNQFQGSEQSDDAVNGSKPSEEEDPEEPKLSIAERIFKMESKIEENKYSKSYAGSGATTPRVLKLRSAISGPASPGGTSSPQTMTMTQVQTSPTVDLTDQQLLAKLTDVAVIRDAADRRRANFQEKDESWRTRTQPVTNEEVHEADRLQTELKDIPEAAPVSPTPPGTSDSQPISRKKMVRKKVEAARAAAFEDSDSDFDKIVDLNRRKAQIEMAEKTPEGEDDRDPDPLCKMSVSQKMALFRKMEEEEKEKKKSSGGSKRFQDRRKRLERSRTQPVTEDEIGQAAVIAKEQKAEAEAQIEEREEMSSVSRSISSSLSMENVNNQVDVLPEEVLENGANVPDDDLSKLSLSEKMKLFSQTDDKSSSKKDTPVVRRKTRRLQSRFKTQPITPEEVEKAAATRISPLALSMVKPPDPEILQTMSLKDQKDYMAKWATETLKQLGSRPTSALGGVRPRPGSDGEEEREGSSKGKSSVRGILKPEQKAEIERELRGILRAAGAPFPLDSTFSTIRADPSGPVRQPPQGILKKESPQVGQSESIETKSILKKEITEMRIEPSKGMLKKEIETKVDQPEKSVLKKDSTFERAITEPEKPSLKMDHDVRKELVQTTEVRSALKVTSPEAVDQDAKRGILKSRSTDTEQTVVSQGILKSPPSESRELTMPAHKESNTSSGSTPGPAVESQSEEDYSSVSGGPRKIKNEAIARRRHHRELRKQGERYHTQPVEGAEDDVRPATVEMRRAGMQRHHTQPITSSEKENAEEGSVVKDGGIASRDDLSSSDELAQLHKSGEENWKKRIGKKGSPEFEVKMRVKAGDKKERPTSIADRLSLLEGSKDSWRDRIEESDARQFTVAGKLELTGKAMTPDSPLLARKRKPKVPLARALSTPIMHVPSSDDEKEPSGDGPVMVDVPNVNDETLTDFFQSRTVEQLSQEKVTVTVDDFDHVFMEAQDILSSVQKAKPQMRRATASRNPLKTLAQRRDIQSEYIEIRTDIADREMKRIKREQIAGSACYATEALAGLAAKENFAQVMLRKTDSFTSGTPGSKNLDPFKEIMLLQVKGRRHCQIRLVSPEALSLNSGDCFILVCPERCWVWIGEFCNVIERAKAVEVAGIIQNKRDLGCKSPYEPTVMEERAAVPSPVTNKFWEKLGGYGIYQDVGPAEEDEVYEADMAETTRVYRLVGEEFVLWDEVSGCVPRYEMLTTKDILIFDFGSELYLWTGKQAAFPKRKVALKLAKEMWSAGYDYTTYGFNPMCPLIGESQGGLPLTDSQRPDWTLFGKVNQNMETILFREKFFDWPDASRLISVKAPGDDVETKGDVEMVPADVSKMLDVDLSPVSLVLEGSHVGRGNTWTEMYEGLKREYEITTLATKVWHVNEFQVMDIDEISYGHFHDGDTYVVRWQYMIMQTGMKTLKGADARHSLVGRERCAYFFWQGRDSSVNEKGASALMTVELDEERGPQIRVVQDKEPPCFLNLFKSKMVVHIGKRESADTCTQGPHRLYIIRNELKGEAHLTEVKCELTSLRSRGSFVLINVETGKMLLWNGSKAGMNTKQRALEIAQNLKSSCPLEMGIKPSVKLVMTKMDEGLETEEFWKAIKSTDISVYVSMLDDVRGWSHMPRLFCLTSVSGEFKALEIINPCRSPNICSPFPFIQTDLYTAQQPALFMLDNNHELYLWQGWWPEAKEDAENVNTGSAVARFITDRKCALQTVLNYCQAKNPMTPIPSFVVYGGLEPKIFTNLFPYWENNEEATASNLKEGKKPNERTPCKAMLNKLVNTRYTFDQLQERPLPDGVDPLRLEDYLKEDEFERVLGMSREEFQERPRWKQDEIKKEHSLF